MAALHGGPEGPQELEWVRSRVLNVVGHELRTPVSTLRGLADALAGGDLPERERELAGILRASSVRLERLVDELLVAEGITTALPASPVVTVDLADASRLAWSTVGGEGATLLIRGAPAVARARADAVARILAAVFDNAARYGGRPVTASFERVDSTVRVVVNSPGPTLPPEDVRFATQPFWRGERAVMSSSGLGLGLWVAHLLAENEGGSLSVEAGDAGGLVTNVVLPA